MVRILDTGRKGKKTTAERQIIKLELAPVTFQMCCYSESWLTYAIANLHYLNNLKNGVFQRKHLLWKVIINIKTV